MGFDDDMLRRVTCSMRRKDWVMQQLNEHSALARRAAGRGKSCCDRSSPARDRRSSGCCWQHCWGRPCATRIYQIRALPLSARHFYPANYSLSLSLVAGHGFQDLPIGDTPAAKPICEFLELQQERLTPDELDRCYREPRPETLDPRFLFWDVLATTRVLDVYLAAGLWKCFGISWYALFYFYAGQHGLLWHDLHDRQAIVR